MADVTSRWQTANRAVHRTGIATLAVGILGLVGIWLLNQSISEAEVQYQSAYQWYQDTASMLGRARAFRAQSAALFEGLALTGLHPYATEPVVAYDAEGTIDEYSPVSAKTILNAQKFGAAAGAIIRRTSTVPDRIKLLGEAARRFFSPSEAKMLVTRSTIVLSAPVAVMASVDQPNMRPSILDWVVYGLSPGLPGITGQNTNANSYEVHGVQWTVEDESDYVRSELSLANNWPEVQSSLRSVWEKAHLSVASQTAVVPRIALGGTGLLLRLDDALMWIGPILAFMQGMFLIVRREERRLGHELRRYVDEAPSVFRPQGDPLREPRTRELPVIMQRTVWTLFLTLPPILIVTGILTRYQLATPWFAPTLIDRGWDWSTILDGLNLGSLYVSIMSVIELTAASAPISLRRSYAATRKGRLLSRGALLAFLAAALVWTIYSTFAITIPSQLLLIVLGVIWVRALTEAYHRDSLLTKWMASAGIGVVLLLAIYMMIVAGGPSGWVVNP